MGVSGLPALKLQQYRGPEKYLKKYVRVHFAPVFLRGGAKQRSFLRVLEPQQLNDCAILPYMKNEQGSGGNEQRYPVQKPPHTVPLSFCACVPPYKMTIVQHH